MGMFTNDTVSMDTDPIEFGEWVVLEVFANGIWVPDPTTGKKVLSHYDPNKDEHKAVIAAGKKPWPWTVAQWFPIGATYNSYPQSMIVFSQEWKEWKASLAKLWGINPRNTQAITDKLNAECDGKSIYARWETEVIEEKDNNGEDRKRYVRRAVELYPTLQAAQDAYDKHYNINGQVDKMPEGATVKVLERNQALGFIRTWATNNKENGKVDTTELQAFIDSMPMLGAWEISDPDIQAIVNELDGVPF